MNYKVFLETLIPASLVVLAADLLYLFYIGAWFEPSFWILISEIIALLLCIVLGIWGVYHSIKEAREE